MKDENEFQILARFLERFGEDVEGHTSAPMPSELRARVEDFVQGRLAESEREELLETLRGNPEWIGLLAESVKAQRGGQETG